MMPVTPFDDPVAISIFGDSWKSAYYESSTSYVKNPLASIAMGFGYNPAGKDYTFINFSWGGVSAKDAYEGTGAYNDPDKLDILAPFQVAASRDFAKYQVFHYGYNDVKRHIPFDTASVFPKFGVEYHSQIPESSLISLEYQIYSEMVTYFSAFVDASKLSGRKPVLSKLCGLSSFESPSGWKWTPQHTRLLNKVNQAVEYVSIIKGVRVIDQSDVILSPHQMIDYVHPNTKFSHRINLDYGIKLRAIIDSGY